MSRRPTIPPPTVAKIAELAAKAGLECEEDELKEYAESIATSMEDYVRIYDLPEPPLPMRYSRNIGSVHKPLAEDNPLNAWSYKMCIKGARSGKLIGKKIALKDNIQIAGVPMVNGSELIRGFVPTDDATVVTRILDEGGSIVGTTNVEDMCVSGGSFTGLNGRVLNPHDKTRVAGGSSSGSAVVLVTGEADMALGCDQGGSIRIPASYCGLVGLKPTHGLVPYTGVVPIETTLDHIGPMARTVADCALMLEVIAGYDGGLDPRQHRDVETQEYTKLMMDQVTGKRIGILKEGFECCDEEVCEVVKKSFKYFEGFEMEEVSIPWHKDGTAIWGPAVFEGTTETMINGRGVMYGMKGYKSTGMVDHLDKTVKTKLNFVSKPMKFVYLFGTYIKETCGPGYYAKASNLLRSLTQAYDEVLNRYDVLVMPTMQSLPPKLPLEELNAKDACALAFGGIKNTAPFNFTGHPALSINAGFSKADNLPVGLMIVGKHFDEATVLGVAHMFEHNNINGLETQA